MYKIYSPSVLTLLLTYNHQTYTHSNLTSKQINGARKYTHISINTHTLIHTRIHTYTHTDTVSDKEVASEVNWNGSTVKKGRFSGLS